MQAEYGGTIDDSNYLWTIEALQAVAAGLGALRDAMRGSLFPMIVEGITFTVYENSNQMGYIAGVIRVGDGVLSNIDYITTYTVHEMAHVWDEKTNESKSTGLVKATGGTLPSTDPMVEYKPGGRPPTKYATNHPYEDWAESLKVTVFPSKSESPMDEARESYVLRQLNHDIERWPRGVIR